MTNVPNDELLIRYLLGADLAEAEQAGIEGQLFADTHFVEYLQAMELELMRRYLRGDLNRREHELFESRFLIPQARRDLLNLLQNVIRTSASQENSLAVPAMVSEVAAMGRSPGIFRWKRKDRPTPFGWHRLSRPAAAALVFGIVGAGIAFWNLAPLNKSSSVVSPTQTVGDKSASVGPKVLKPEIPARDAAGQDLRTTFEAVADAPSNVGPKVLKPEIPARDAAGQDFRTTFETVADAPSNVGPKVLKPEIPARDAAGQDFRTTFETVANAPSNVGPKVLKPEIPARDAAGLDFRTTFEPVADAPSNTRLASTSNCLQMDPQLALARLKTRVDPAIPAGSLASIQNTQVTVRVKARIDESGNVTAMEVTGSNVIINNAIRTAVEQWKFTPIADRSGSRCVNTEFSLVLGK